MCIPRPFSRLSKLHIYSTFQTTAMSASPEEDKSQSSKRPLEISSSDEGGTKRVKSEPVDPVPQNDDQFNDLFDDPIFNQNGDNNGAADINTAVDDIELPDFLMEGKTEDSASQTVPGGSDSSTSTPVPQANTAPVTAMHSNRGLKLPEVQRPSSVGPTRSSNQLNRVPLSQSTLQTSQVGDLTGEGNTSQGISSQGGSSLPPSATAMDQSQSQYPYLNYTRTLPQYLSPGRGGYRQAPRFDPRRTYPAPTGMSGSYSTSSVPGAYNSTTTPSSQAKEDPDQYKDAIHAAGVDILREEELLSSGYNRGTLSLQQQQLANRQRQLYGLANPFLQTYHLGLFMNRIARENGVYQNFMADPEMLDFVSAASKEWLSKLVTKMILLARHRRRGIPALIQAKGNQKLKLPPNQRSDVSKELRNIALRHKEQEEARVQKRLALGIENKDDVAPETANKAGAEETLHRAANATAAMMTGASSRKKYSWMKSGGGSGAGDDNKQGAAKDGGPKQSSILASRGDNGLRYREIRTGNMVTTKDLLGVLEDERVGTSKAVIKGYAKLKD